MQRARAGLGESKSEISVLLSSVAVVVSTLGLIFAVVSFRLNRQAAARTERYSRMPVLLPKSPIDPDYITLQNIGKGPALNIIIAHGIGALGEQDALNADLSGARKQGLWRDHCHLEPIAAGAERCTAGISARQWAYRIQTRSEATTRRSRT